MLLSMVHTIPFADPFEETEGVAPGNPYAVDDWEVGVGLNSPVAGLKEKAVNEPPTPATNRLFCQKTGVEKMLKFNGNICTTPLSAAVNCPIRSRFNT